MIQGEHPLATFLFCKACGRAGVGRGEAKACLVCVAWGGEGWLAWLDNVSNTPPPTRNPFPPLFHFLHACTRGVLSPKPSLDLCWLLQQHHHVAVATATPGNPTHPLLSFSHAHRPTTFLPAASTWGARRVHVRPRPRSSRFVTTTTSSPHPRPHHAVVVAPPCLDQHEPGGLRPCLVIGRSSSSSGRFLPPRVGTDAAECATRTAPPQGGVGRGAYGPLL